MSRIEKKIYTGWLAIPGIVIYVVIFVIPTFASFYFSMTTWNLKTSVFTGVQNFVTFFTMANNLCVCHLFCKSSAGTSHCTVSVQKDKECRISESNAFFPDSSWQCSCSYSI